MIKDKCNYSLLGHNTFGINARCRRFIEFTSISELKYVLSRLTSSDEPLMILGEGSNLLLTKDFNGTVLHSAIRHFEKTNDGDSFLLKAGSGERWDDIVAMAVQNGMYGAENLSLIPGEVGASAVQNIGAYGTEIKELIHEVGAIEIATGKEFRFTAQDCMYSYRESRFKRDWKDLFVITYVIYRFSKSFCPHLDYGNIRVELEKRGINNPTAEELRNVVIDIRRAKLPDPDVEGNAGSFFMNPIVSREKYFCLKEKYPDIPHYTIDHEHEKIPAGWMIDKCGWKGCRLGNAGVHDKQALVLVNKGGASGLDIVRLSDKIRHDVKSKFDIDIYPEVNIK